MKDDPFKTTEKRLWNEAIREGLLQKSMEEHGPRIRKALKSVSQDVKNTGDLVLALSGLMAGLVAGLEVRHRVDTAILKRALGDVLARLPEDDRKAVEHDIRTPGFEDIAL